MTLARFQKHMIGFVGAALFVASTASVANAGPNCHCRSSTGEKIQVGNFTCLKTNSGLQEAKCDYVLNNTAWKLTGNACPSASLDNDKPRNAVEISETVSVAKLDFSKPL